jgi:hypothetical protein
MSIKKSLRRSDEGAALLLVLGFVVFMSAVTGGLVGYLSTTIKQRVPLDSIREREYAADGAIEYAITQVRSLPHPGTDACGSAAGSVAGHYVLTLNAKTIRVNCINANETVAAGGNNLIQVNVVFTACEETGVDCTPDAAIIRAQVNYETPLVPAGTNSFVNRTYIQSWSVNR